MKQKVLGGATIVLSASVNSFGSSSKDGKDNKDLDFSKLEEIGKIGDIVLTGDNDKVITIGKAKDKGNKDLKTIIVEAIKGKSGSPVEIDLGANGKTDKLTEAQSGELKLEANSDGKKLDISLTKLAENGTLDGGKLWFIISKGNNAKFNVMVIKKEKKIKITDLAALKFEEVDK